MLPVHSTERVEEVGDGVVGRLLRVVVDDVYTVTQLQTASR